MLAVTFWVSAAGHATAVLMRLASPRRRLGSFLTHGACSVRAAAYFFRVPIRPALSSAESSLYRSLQVSGCFSSGQSLLCTEAVNAFTDTSTCDHACLVIYVIYTQTDKYNTTKFLCVIYSLPGYRCS